MLDSEGENLLIQCLRAGATDLGGISPIDEVNPTYTFPKIEELSEALRHNGFQLRNRSCVHSSHMDFLNEKRDFGGKYNEKAKGEEMQGSNSSGYAHSYKFRARECSYYDDEPSLPMDKLESRYDRRQVLYQRLLASSSIAI